MLLPVAKELFRLPDFGTKCLSGSLDGYYHGVGIAVSRHTTRLYVIPTSDVLIASKNHIVRPHKYQY